MGFISDMLQNVFNGLVEKSAEIDDWKMRGEEMSDEKLKSAIKNSSGLKQAALTQVYKERHDNN